MSVGMDSDVRTYGLETTHGRFYSEYRGICADTKDPLGIYRIKVVCPIVAGNKPLSRWALPSFEGAGKNSGIQWVPDEGDPVLVWFDNGDPNHPNYGRGWFANQPKDGNDIPVAFRPTPGKKPTRRGMATKKGHMLLFDDADGAELVQLVWSNSGDPSAAKSKAVVGIDKDGTISIVAPSGQRLVLDEKNGQLMYTLLDPQGSALCIMTADTKNGWVVSSSSGGQVQSTIALDGKGNATMMGQKSVAVSAPSIALSGTNALGGSKAVFSLVLGEVLVQLLQQLITQVAAITVQTGTGPSSPPVNAAAIAALASSLQGLLSKSQMVAP